jgi:hypothetical protein
MTAGTEDSTMDCVKITTGITALIGTSVLLLAPLDAAATRVDSPARVGFDDAEVADEASTASVELSFDSAAVDQTIPGVWVGTVAGDITGTLLTRMTDLRVSGPIWHVGFEWTITAADPFASRPGAPLDIHSSQTTMMSGQSFVADLSGVLNNETGAVVMDGTVVEGYLLGAQVHEEGQLINADRLRFEGTIEVTAAEALTTDAGGTSGMIAGSSAATISDTAAETSVATAPDATAVETVSASNGSGPVVTPFAEFGSDDFVTGSTIGPDGALYVTDGVAGAVLRIDGSSGDVSPYADGLPPKAFPDADIGGPVDVAFTGETAYVLVTLASGNLNGEPFGDPEAKNGLFRIEPDGSNTLVADLGQWSVDHPPEPAIIVDTGVHFSLESYPDGFLVTDGHHNRVLQVTQDGSIDEVATFDNVVPTGLEAVDDDIFITQMGPIPHLPEDGKVIALGPNSDTRDLASGATMLIDVEHGPDDQLYAVSQGQWDGVGEGSRADPNTGRLLVVEPDGDLTPVVDGDGNELVLDRPTSVEFDGATGYVVSVTGMVYRVDGL